MKESVKITVIAAGFREVAGKKTHTRPSYLPKTWKAGREQEMEPEVRVAPEPQPRVAPEPSVVQQVARTVHEVIHEIPADDLDVPTFLRRQAQKA